MALLKISELKLSGLVALAPCGPANGGDCWETIERALRSPNVRTAYVWGVPGLGKTWAAYHVGVPEAGVYALTLTEETPAAELRGHYLPVGDGMEWRDGPATTAMRRGARLVVNELTHGSPDVLSLMLPLLENLDTARLTLPTGETVQPAPGFQLVCSDNSPPEALPEALRDRFDATLHVDRPHPAGLASLGNRLRAAAERTYGLEGERRISLRGWLSVQRLVPEFGLEGACRVVFGAARGAAVYESLVIGVAPIPR